MNQLQRIIFNRWIIRHFSLVILILLSFQTHLTGQTYPFSVINKEDGLSSTKIYSVIQDRNDYIWLGTGSGLDRFDGKTINPVSTDDGIWHGGVWSIMEDSGGIVWFGHLNGKISYFDGRNFNKISR